MGTVKSKASWLSGIIGAIAGAVITVAAGLGIINVEQKIAAQEAVVVVQDATVYTGGVIDDILVELNNIKADIPKEEFKDLQDAIKDKDFSKAQDLLGTIATAGSKESVTVAVKSIKLKLTILKDLAGYIAQKNYEAAKALITPKE